MAIMLVGINTHPFRAHAHVSLNKHVEYCQALGVRLVRADVYSDTDSLALRGFAELLWAVKLQLLPVVLPGIGLSEEESYSKGWNLGTTVAKAAMPNMTAFELLNEVDVACILGPMYDGDRPTHYDMAKFRCYRGALRGLIDSIRSILPQAQLLFGSGGWKHTALPQMMWDGSEPDGSIADAGLTWDGSVLHHYAGSGSITQMGRSSFNALDIAKRSFECPIWLTEIGWDKPHDDNRQLQTAYLRAALRQYVRLAEQYDIEAAIVYELFDSAGKQFGIMKPDGTAYPAFDVVHQFALEQS